MINDKWKGMNYILCINMDDILDVDCWVKRESYSEYIFIKFKN